MLNPRPISLLNALIARHPGLPKQIEQAYFDARGHNQVAPPEWLFLSMSAWFRLAAAKAGPTAHPLSIVADTANLAAIGAWRYSQGIYRLHAEMLSALASSTVKGSLPCSVFYRLPEWSLYIETPGLNWYDRKLFGYWSHLEWDATKSRPELRLLLDCEHDLVAQSIHLGDWTVTEAVDRVIVEAAETAASAGSHLPSDGQAVQNLAEQINPLIAILLYICSDEPEIDNDRTPGEHPSRPQPKKTKKGLRLFAPDKPRIWRLGEHTGQTLATAKTASSNGDRSGVRTHIRRAHWHGYWIGPRSGDQEFRYKWVSPTVVAANKEDE